MTHKLGTQQRGLVKVDTVLTPLVNSWSQYRRERRWPGDETKEVGKVPRECGRLQSGWISLKRDLGRSKEEVWAVPKELVFMHGLSQSYFR